MSSNKFCYIDNIITKPLRWLSLSFVVGIFGLTMLGTAPANADDVVNLKVLVISTGDATQDLGLAYITPILDEMGVPYDVINSVSQELTTAQLSASPSTTGCALEVAGCVGKYNGVILTSSDLGLNFTPAEWDVLHNYERNFHVREAVLSGWPGTYWDPNAPWGIYLDYGLVYISECNSILPCNAQWTIPADDSKAVFEYVNRTNTLPITDFAFTALPRNDGTGPRDGTIPNVVPLLQTPGGGALVSIIRYTLPAQTTPVREVMLSTITNASFLIHSQVLGYEFVNWVTQGVYVGGRFVHMTAHLDDLFLEDELWNPSIHGTDPLLSYRLNSNDITNAVSQQVAFRATHPLAGNAFKLDFPFNGAGAVEDQTASVLTAKLTDDLVASVVANKNEFRFINHTFTHPVMDKAPVPANALCDYATLSTVSAIKAEITKNRTVWGLLGLPEQSANNRVLVSGNHSGLKDMKCTSTPELHPEMVNVQDDDVPFVTGANPLFFQAAANASVDYLASDSSQLNQNAEQYIIGVNDGSKTDRILLPRWPTSIFYNTTQPDQLADEYNYIFHYRFINAGQDPCVVPGALCAPRDYASILTAEANSTLRHMLTFKKWPHYFHQTNAAKYDVDGNSLQFDWLDSVFTAYEQLFTLPVKNLPYYLIGDKTKERLIANSAIIQATWNRTTNKISLSANKAVPNLLVTGVNGGDLYGGQYLREISINTTPKTFNVNQGLTQ